jgi:RNA-directed DNA polymerase
MDKTKSFDIPKKSVYEAYLAVKKNKGAAGIDGVSIAELETDLKNNLYKLWNRMSSGTYFPPAVKAVDIPKKTGGIRTLGIPTVADRIAQMVVKMQFEPKVEKYFHSDSYGYRPGKSAHDAIDITRKRCWKYDWVLEFDIKGLFDNIDHELLLKAVRKHTESKWELLYIKRWLTAPFQKADGEIIKRERGTPQGGVISPILANLFLHYCFDKWMERTFPNNPWCRYADDGIVHCTSEKQAQYLKDRLEKRFRECKLEIHPGKTRIVYCKDSNRVEGKENIDFTFLGYTFKPRKAKGKGGKVFTSFLPAISQKAKSKIFEEIRDWRLLWMTQKSIKQIAEDINPAIHGWLNYYGRYGKKEIARVLDNANYHLMLWVRRKFKRCKRSPWKAYQFLQRIHDANPKLFAHWEVGISPSTG